MLCPFYCTSSGVGYHGNNEACTVKVLAAGALTATEFSTESCCDYVTIGGTRYAGTSGPQNVRVAENEAFTWRTDHSGTRSGWVLCWGAPVPTASPTTDTRTRCVPVGAW